MNRPDPARLEFHFNFENYSFYQPSHHNHKLKMGRSEGVDSKMETVIDVNINPPNISVKVGQSFLFLLTNQQPPQKTHREHCNLGN